MKKNTGHSHSVLRAIGLLGLVLGSGCQQQDELKVIGLNSFGQETVAPVSMRMMANVLTKSFEKTHRGVLQSASEQSDRNLGFELARVTAGLKLEVEGEIEGVMELGGEAVMELRYQPLPAPKGVL
jgi:hypothetical protein